jgi:anti-sigma factor RsiW
MIRGVLARRRYMREHRWTHAHLSEYLDGELADGERRRVEAHTSICPQCTRVLATLRRTLERLRMLSADRPPGLAEGVIERLRQEPAG